MPIYEYGCRECGHVFDVLQKISDAPPADCPACGAAAPRRLVSAPSFRLKGSGWYETDFKKEGKRWLADPDTQSSLGSGNATEGQDGKASRPKAGDSQEGAGHKHEPKPKPAQDHGHAHKHDHGSHSHKHEHKHGHGHKHGPGHKHEH
ncbi:MAG: zinc ribbon domain-containing protein [Chromatiales bacterium]|nr:zinc ribbon domain-containing protein [Chromatiales bacterium]